MSLIAAAGLLPDIIGVATRLAPGLLRLIGSDKAAETVETVTKVAKDVLGTTDGAEADAKLAIDPALREQFLARLNADTERYRLELEDLQSARGRDVEVRKSSASGTNLRANIMLAGAFVTLVMVLFCLFWFDGIRRDVLVILNTAVGSLMTLLGQAFNFEFGSSRSSGEKTDHFAEIMRTMAQNGSPPAALKK